MQIDDNGQRANEYTSWPNMEAGVVRNPFFGHTLNRMYQFSSTGAA